MTRNSHKTKWPCYYVEAESVTRSVIGAMEVSSDLDGAEDVLHEGKAL